MRVLLALVVAVAATFVIALVLGGAFHAGLGGVELLLLLVVTFAVAFWALRGRFRSRI